MHGLKGERVLMRVHIGERDKYKGKPLYAAIVGHRPEAKRWDAAVAGGVATSATAYVIDYTITPKRFTPGYEHRLDGRGMLVVYGVLAAALGVRAISVRTLLLRARRDARRGELLRVLDSRTWKARLRVDVNPRSGL